MKRQKIRRLTLRDRKSGRPLISQDIQTDGSIGVDVWVVDLGRKADLGRLEWVIGGESDGKEEDTASVGGVTLDQM